MTNKSCTLFATMGIILLFAVTSLSMGTNAVVPPDTLGATPDDSDSSLIQVGEDEFATLFVEDNVTTIELPDGTIITIDSSEDLTYVEFYDMEGQMSMEISVFPAENRMQLSTFDRTVPDTPVELKRFDVTSMPSVEGAEPVAAEGIDTEILAMDLVSNELIDVDARSDPVDGTDVSLEYTNLTDSTGYMVNVHQDTAIHDEGAPLDLEFGVHENREPANLDNHDMIGTLEAVPIPSDFFEPGSEPFGGVILNTTHDRQHDDGSTDTHAINASLVRDGLDVHQQVDWMENDGALNDRTSDRVIIEAEPLAPGMDTWTPTQPADSPINVFMDNDVIYISYDHLTLAVYFDKLVINFRSNDGYYIPIIIFFVVWEVHIVIEYVTIIVYLEVVELVVVLIVYEIKIEIYVYQIIIVYQIIEIVIYLLQIFVYYIQINIYYITYVIQVFIHIVVNVIILPIWIIFIPIIIFVPVFIPVFIPVFVMFPVFIPVYYPCPVYIPVPTPVPFIPAGVEIDLFNQTMNEPDDMMTLTYNVTDLAGNPLLGGTVDVTIEGIVYPATELGGGLYQVTTPYVANTTVDVLATVPNYPTGFLSYVQFAYDSSGNITATETETETVTSESTVTQTCTNITKTVTEEVADTDASRDLSFSAPLALAAILIASMATIVIRRKKKKEY